jgi:hypothetical protein
MVVMVMAVVRVPEGVCGCLDVGALAGLSLSGATGLTALDVLPEGGEGLLGPGEIAGL